MSELNQVYQTESTVSLAKKQNYFVSKVCIFASLIFALIFSLSYVIGEFWLSKTGWNLAIFSIVGVALLLVSMGFAFYVGVKGLKASFGAILSMIVLYSLSIMLSFSFLFSMVDKGLMFFALALCSITMFITGILGFIISPKAANIIWKISSISIAVYFVASLVLSLISWFIIGGFEIWLIVLTLIIGLVIICSNIFSFYQLKKYQEFASLELIDKNDLKKLTTLAIFNVLSSIVSTFMWILRMLLIFGRGN